MVHAEKIVTAIQRGIANTRWRDFADIHALTRRHDTSGEELRAAIVRVASYRQVTLAPLQDVLEGYPALAQQRRAAWRRRSSWRGACRGGSAMFSMWWAPSDPFVADLVTDTWWSTEHQHGRRPSALVL